MATKCPKCHSDNPETASFCADCGTRLSLHEGVSASVTKTLVSPTVEGSFVAGRYRILGKLGEGGMGVVYKAEDTRLKRTVALKFMPPELTRDPEAKERFMREAQAAAALSHPHICTIHEIDEEEGKSFITMEYMEGQSIRERIKKGPLDLAEALSIALQAAQGLEEAHKKGIIHRDIKSANIMVTGLGQAKVMDFGLAKVFGASLITKEAKTMGTVAYMSPEQAQGRSVDHRTDIWSLGVVLYEMLTAQLPFKGEHDQAVMYSILNEKPNSITKVRSDIPMAVEQIIGKALEKKPDSRYQQVAELIDDLKSVAEGLEPEGIRARLRKARLLKRKMAILYAGIAVLLIVITVVALSLFTGRSQVIDSIAVLPLENLTGNPDQEYFVDGMTEALIANLAKISSLRVISRTSIMQYKNARKPLPDIARELNVKAVVEGSVVLSEGRVRISARLIDAPKERHIWADTFDRDSRDILALQNEVSAAIAREIQLKLTPQEKELLANKRQVKPDAYQLYLQGREHYNNTFDNKKALECFRQATVIDPTFAEAYAGMALSYIQMGLPTIGGAPPQEVFPRVKAAAMKAIELDDTIGLAFAALGDVKLWFDWDWEGAEESYRHALDLAPQNTDIIFTYSRYMDLMGRFDESIALSKRALELDPLSALLSINLGAEYMWARSYDEGIAHLLKIREMFPSQTWSANYYLAWNYVGKGMYQKAIELVDKSEKAWQVDPFTLTYFYAVSGQRDKALELLEKLLERSKTEYIEPAQVAMIYCGLGDKEQALRWLTKGYENRTPYMITLKTDPSFDPLRSDPRFTDLLRKVGF